MNKAPKLHTPESAANALQIKTVCVKKEVTAQQTEIIRLASMFFSIQSAVCVIVKFFWLIGEKI